MIFPILFAIVLNILLNFNIGNSIVPFNEINKIIDNTDEIYVNMSTYFSYCRDMQNWKQNDMYCHDVNQFPDLDQTSIYIVYDVFVMDLQNKKSCEILSDDKCKKQYKESIGQNFYKSGLIKSNLNVIFPHNFFSFRYENKNFTVHYYLNFNHHGTICEPEKRHNNKIICKNNNIMQNKNIYHKEIILKDTYEYIISDELSTSMEKLFIESDINKLINGEHVITKKYRSSIFEYENPHICVKYS